MAKQKITAEQDREQYDRGPDAPQADADAASPDPRDEEIARLKAQLAARLDELRQAQAAPQEAARPGTYRVSLHGCKVRAVDGLGRVEMRDSMDVEAISPGDAWMRFCEFNGILRSDHKPAIELLPGPEEVPAAE